MWSGALRTGGGGNLGFVNRKFKLGFAKSLGWDGQLGDLCCSQDKTGYEADVIIYTIALESGLGVRLRAGLRVSGVESSMTGRCVLSHKSRQVAASKKCQPTRRLGMQHAFVACVVAIDQSVRVGVDICVEIALARPSLLAVVTVRC